MEWLTGIRSAIDFIENNLENDISVQDVADKVFISPIFLQRGFSLMTGFSVGEYIRNRRLYQAALDLVNTEDMVIVIAYRYCYETPESFTKAFSRFHGVTPSQVRNSTGFDYRHRIKNTAGPFRCLCYLLKIRSRVAHIKFRENKT
jgi:AraC family transcriptional regulator